MKLTKRQWRMLMTELLETRNEATDNHVCATSQFQALSDRLCAIERRLPPENMDLRTYEIMPDGTRRECAE